MTTDRRRPWPGTAPGHRTEAVDLPGQGVWELTVLGLKEKPVSLGDGFGCDVTIRYSRTVSASDLPVLWLDNDTILTTTANNRLVSVNVKDGSRSEIVRIKPAPSDPFVTMPPKLFRDEAGAVIYSCGDAVYRIDVAKKTYEWTDRKPLGHGFEFTQTPPWKMEQVIFRNAKESAAGGERRCSGQSRHADGPLCGDGRPR